MDEWLVFEALRALIIFLHKRKVHYRIGHSKVVIFHNRAQIYGLRSRVREDFEVQQNLPQPLYVRPAIAAGYFAWFFEC